MGYLEIMNDFVDTMKAEQGRFEKIQNEVSRVEHQVKESLEELSSTVSQRIKIFEKNELLDQDKMVRNIFDGVAKDINLGVYNATEQVRETINGMKFIEEFEKKFTVAVFGKVKAGKSYIGNFIMGNTLKNLEIPSSYDSLRPLTVHIYDRGKLSTQEELATFEDEKELSELKTGKTETTSSIQWFDIGALSWFDTPGIGSVTWENEMLAKEYVKNADLVIYASNSDAAGTRQDFSEMQQLLEMKKPILLLLTQSDTYEEDEDEDGNIISELVPKSEKDRKDQELYIRNTLKEQGMTEVEKYAQVLTVSAYLADYAIKTKDEKKFSESNMGQLLEVLKKITLNEAAEMKRSTPRNRINSMIDRTIDEISQIRQKVEEKCDRIIENQNNLQERKVGIVEKIKAEVKHNVLVYMDQQETMIEKEGKVISEEEMIRQVNGIVNKIVKKVCSEELKVIRETSLKMSISNIGSMEMKKDTIEWEEVEVERTIREPKGILEKIGSFFGKEYYQNDTTRRTRRKTFDLGVNKADITGKLIKQLDRSLKEHVGEFVATLCDGYYKPVHELQSTICEVLTLKMEELDAMRI